MTELTAQIESKTRLDIFLADSYPSISRSFLQKLCSSDQVLVNNIPQKSGYKLHPGDSVTIIYDIDGIEKIEDISLPLLYEDDDVLVVNKPAGVISHARGRYWNEPSVASFVRQITGQDGDRAGIVHRLDRATSGVMICAKTVQAMAFLQKQFSSRTVNKTYMAVVRGHMDPPEAIIDMAIERNPKKPSTFRVGPNGKTAQTKYKVIATCSDYELLELKPVTGRTHQLRVHLMYAGHPIIGDQFYGGEEKDRLYLHAHTLQLMIPNKTLQTFEAPLPPEFNALIESRS